MKKPTSEAMDAATAFMAGYDIDGKQRGECTTGLCWHVRPRDGKVSCSLDITALARLLDTFRGRLLPVPDDSHIKDPESAF